jgi:hypothetical protein
MPQAESSNFQGARPALAFALRRALLMSSAAMSVSVCCEWVT